MDAMEDKMTEIMWRVSLTIDIHADSQEEAARIFYDIVRIDQPVLTFDVADPEKEFPTKFVEITPALESITEPA